MSCAKIFELALSAILAGGACSRQSPETPSDSAGAAHPGMEADAANDTAPIDSDAPVEPVRLLVFTKTSGFRHSSIEHGVTAVRGIAAERAWQVEHTEDAAVFEDARLAKLGAVIWLNTTGDVLGADQQAAFERYIRAGGGYVGIHSASDTEYDWLFYGSLVGAYFSSHPQIQTATLRVEDRSHPATAHLGTSWQRTDEWYDFRQNPRPSVRVLISIEEATYTGGNMGDHPMAWYHEFEGGRAFYTALGHTDESYTEPDFVRHLAGGIAWAAAR
jgi:type 1 glutamine amidotransferase